MNRTLQIKLTRFIELSKKFSKTEEEIFTPEEMQSTNFNGCISLSQSGSVSYTLTTNSYPIIEVPSRAEEIMERAALRADLSDDFDEFLYLQEELEEYFEKLNRVTEI